MSGLDDDHHKDRPSSWRQKPRKSMDLEFHDLDLDSLDDELQYQKLIADGSTKNVSGNKSKTLPNGGNYDEDADDPDDDSFGEASDDCEPDQKYLDELLEEYHPERVNLLDHNIPPRISVSDDGNNDDDDDDESYQKKTRRRNGLLSPRSRRDGAEHSSNHSFSSSRDSDDDENDFPPHWSSSRLGSDTTPQRDADIDDDVAKVEVEGTCLDPENGNPPKVLSNKCLRDDHDQEVLCGTTEDSSAPEEGEDDLQGDSNHGEDAVGNDVFSDSPKRPRRRLKDQLESMGIAGKKSFRQVSKTTFWAQPFKGLGRPKHKGKEAAVEEQEVAS